MRALKENPNPEVQSPPISSQRMKYWKASSGLHWRIPPHPAPGSQGRTQLEGKWPRKLLQQRCQWQHGLWVPLVLPTRQQGSPLPARRWPCTKYFCETEAQVVAQHCRVDVSWKKVRHCIFLVFLFNFASSRVNLGNLTKVGKSGNLTHATASLPFGHF